MTNALLIRPTTFRKPGRYATLKLYPVLSQIAPTRRTIAALVAQRRHYDLLRHLGLLPAAANDAPVLLRNLNIKVARPSFGWRPMIEKRLNPDPMIGGPAPKTSNAKTSKKPLRPADVAAQVLSFYRRYRDVYRPIVSYSGGRVVYGYSFSRRLKKSEDPSLD